MSLPINVVTESELLVEEAIAMVAMERTLSEMGK
jgi:hypothetical protein